MDVFLKFCIGAAIVLAGIFLVCFIFFIKAVVETKILLNSGVKSNNLVYKLMCANFRKSHIMRTSHFPFTSEAQSKLFRADVIAVNRGGILLITVRDLRGTVENPFRGDWRQFLGTKIMQMPNPLETNGLHTRSLDNILKREGVKNVPVKSVVVYFDEKTKFKNRVEQIMCITKLVSYAKDMNKDRFLTGHEIRNTVSVLRRCRRRVKPNPNQGANPNAKPRA